MKLTVAPMLTLMVLLRPILTPTQKLKQTPALKLTLTPLLILTLMFILLLKLMLTLALKLMPILMRTVVEKGIVESLAARGSGPTVTVALARPSAATDPAGATPASTVMSA